MKTATNGDAGILPYRNRRTLAPNYKMVMKCSREMGTQFTCKAYDPAKLRKELESDESTLRETSFCEVSRRVFAARQNRLAS